MPKKNPRSHVLLPLAFLVLHGLIAARGHAEVTLDGSLGPSGALAGPEFVIRADMGQQVDTNLFHSFGIFNINMDESATFTGEGSIGSIENVLGRVTGGTSSNIDGMLRSTIPGADLFLINPAGIMFGPNAQLDVPGSFHASTADFVRLEDGVRFNAVPSSDDALLTTAPPEAFGFLNEDPAGISMQGSHLQVPGEETLSVVSGDIEIKDGTLHAPGGRINLAAVASRGEVVPTDSDLEVGSFEALGAIDITQTASERPEINDLPIANVDVSGEGGGAVFIRGGQFTSQGGWVFADTLGDKAGRGVHVSVDGDLVLKGGALITSDTAFGDGDAGDLTVKAGSLAARSNAAISASTFDAGGGGNLVVKADDILLSGDGATGTGITTHAAADSTGNASNLTVKTKSLKVHHGAWIGAFTSGQGDAGELLVEADRVLLSGDGTAFFTGIVAAATSESSGDAGDLAIKAGELEIRDGAEISAATRSIGKGGDVMIRATNVILRDDSNISARSTMTGLDIENNPDVGRSGSISITARDNFGLLMGSSVSVETVEANAGSVDLKVGNLVLLRDQSSITTSVAGGKGNGGNITIDPVFVVLEGGSEIVANGQEGSGGNINIRIVGGGAVFKSLDSVIDASSEVGVNAPDTNISGSIAALPAGFLNVASLLSDRCAARTAETVSSFVVVGRGGVPLSPETASLSAYVDGNLTGQQGDRQSGSHYQQIAKNYQITNQGPLAIIELGCPD